MQEMLPSIPRTGIITGRFFVAVRSIIELAMKIAINESECLALLERIAAGDAKALETFYYRYSAGFGAFLLKMLGRHEWVDEAVNEFMYTLWQSAGRYDPAKGKLSTWLFGIAHNKGLKILERHGRYREESLDENYFAADNLDEAGEPAVNQIGMGSHAEPEKIVSGWQLGEAMSWAFMKLSADHRTVMDLCFNEALSYQEIADITGCPINTVKTRLFHARKRMADLLAQKGIALPETAKATV
jgi:RNA polymerase sigma-70 factor, ECF subfamily